MAGFGIAFIVWLWRARINAENHGWPQRRARGWAFWGWVIPVVSLWIPFQFLGDIWRAGLPERKRNRTAWLPGPVVGGLAAFGDFRRAHSLAATTSCPPCFRAPAGYDSRSLRWTGSR